MGQRRHAENLLLVALNPDFDCWIEHHDGRVWVHHNVFRWNHRVLQRVLQTLHRLQDHLGCDLWVLDNDPEKAPNLPKYLDRLGFVPVELIANDGRLRTAFRRQFK